MNFNNYTGTDVGQKRKANEDAHGDRMTVNGYVFVVCDGMGGHVGGATASQMAVQSILEYFDKEPLDNIIIGIDKAIKFANEQIFATALAQPELKGMGTTATVTVMREEGAYIGHVGDSRIYLKSDGLLNRITKDHSFVQGLVDQGIIKDEDAENHPQKNQILKALGIREDVDATVCDSPIQLKVGDTLLMCSDGLSGLVTDSRMEELVNENNVQQSAVNLINEANQNGGDDNITAALISITESPFTASVFRHFNPVSFNATATVDVSGDMSEEPKFYQNTKLMVILGSSAVVLIAFLTFMLWPNDTTTDDKKNNNDNTKIVQVAEDTIKELNPQELKGLKEKKTVFVTENKDTLKDGEYYCEGYNIEILNGMIDEFNSIITAPLGTGDKALVDEAAAKAQRIEAAKEAADKAAKDTADKAAKDAADKTADDEEKTDSGENTSSEIMSTYTVKEGEGWIAIEQATKCKKADLIKWNNKTDNWDPQKDEPILYKKQ